MNKAKMIELMVTNQAITMKNAKLWLRSPSAGGKSVAFVKTEMEKAKSALLRAVSNPGTAKQTFQQKADVVTTIDSYKERDEKNEENLNEVLNEKETKLKHEYRVTEREFTGRIGKSYANSVYVNTSITVVAHGITRPSLPDMEFEVAKVIPVKFECEDEIQAGEIAKILENGGIRTITSDLDFVNDYVNAKGHQVTKIGIEAKFDSPITKDHVGFQQGENMMGYHTSTVSKYGTFVTK